MPRVRAKMHTRSGKTFPPSVPHQTLKEVRIPFKKRHASAIDFPQLQEDAPASKKQKSHKAVHFEHHADCAHEVPRYKGHFPQESWGSEKERGPSEEVFRQISIEVDESFADSEEEDQGEVLKTNEAEQCVVNTTEDSINNELMAESWEELDEERITPLPDDFHDKEENDDNDQQADLPENGNHQSNLEEQEDPVVDIASSNLSPTNHTDRHGEYKQRYLDLKATAWHWSSTYFPPLTSIPPPSLNLSDLCLTSPQLMEYANYISVCTNDSTWEDVFNEQRTYLVYSILGKMIDVHIFGHEMFGATDEQLHTLRAADEECMMDDGKFLPPQTSHPPSSISPSQPRAKTHPPRLPPPNPARPHHLLLPQQPTAPNPPKLPPLPLTPPSLLPTNALPPPPHPLTTRKHETPPLVHAPLSSHPLPLPPPRSCHDIPLAHAPSAGESVQQQKHAHSRPRRRKGGARGGRIARRDNGGLAELRRLSTYGFWKGGEGCGASGGAGEVGGAGWIAWGSAGELAGTEVKGRDEREAGAAG